MRNIALGTAIILFGCNPIDQAYELAVVPDNILATKCRSDSQKTRTLSGMVIGDWVKVSYDRFPCEPSRSGLSLTNGNDHLSIIVSAFQSDYRIPENVQRMVDFERQAGNQVITVQNPNQGDINNAIAAFARQNPGFRNPKDISIIMHGHGHTENYFSPPLTPLGGQDTIISDQYTPENLVELPRHSSFSAKNATREALTSLQNSGIFGDQSTCNLFIGSCGARGAIESMQESWPAWNQLGLNAAIGASRKDQVSVDNPMYSTSDLPSENLLGTLFSLRRQPDPQLDINNDGVITLGEFRGMAPALQSITHTGVLIGTDLSPQNQIAPHQVNHIVNQIGRDPSSGQGIYEHIEEVRQDLEFAGGDDAPLFTLPRTQPWTPTPQIMQPQQTIPQDSGWPGATQSDGLGWSDGMQEPFGPDF